MISPLLLVLLGYVASGPLALTGRLHPRTLDLFLYRFDQSFGAQLSFKIGQAVLWSSSLTRVAVDVYCALPPGSCLPMRGSYCGIETWQ